jgi:hypothetical protein
MREEDKREEKRDKIIYIQFIPFREYNTARILQRLIGQWCLRETLAA